MKYMKGNKDEFQNWVIYKDLKCSTKKFTIIFNKD